ncbi:MAG: hypothetical protein KJ574_00185 [Nanoarchaeota archaeon]|nr:hypothetical protein [Nanoarchaeota archaeon]
MKKRHQNMTLILFLFFLVISVVPMAIIGTIAYKNSEQNALVIASSESLRFSSLLLTDIDSALSDERSTASTIQETYMDYHIKDEKANEFASQKKYLVFTDFDRNILYTTNPSYSKDIEESASFKEIVEGREGYLVEDEELVTFTSLGRIIAFTHQDIDGVIAPVASFKNKMISFGALVVLLGMIFSFLVAYSIKKSI